ncbi:hypothetical protein HALDL1_11040 [Halobacterium sp. DL1]|jgi:hypothetical protein|nr:hypothetical protein HALDL1_11040 [Halobacterium sp. DL1]
MSVRLLPSRREVATSVVAVAAFVLAAIPSLSDNYIIDETVFVRGMRAVAVRGVPFYYKSEQAGWQYGLWHPPTYIYYVGGWIDTLGADVVVTRGATMLLAALVVPVVVVLHRAVHRLDGVPGSPRLLGLAALLFVASPIAVQDATLIDIDGSLLTLATITFLLWTIWATEIKEWSTGQLAAGLLLWFAAISWVKFGPLPVLLVCVGGYLVVRRGPRLAPVTLGAAVGGFALFSVTWYAVSSALELSFLSPYAHNFGMLFEASDADAASTAKRVMLSAWTLYTELLWVSPFLVALAVLALVPSPVRRTFPSANRIVAGVRERSASALLLSVALATILQYAVLAKMPYGFPKYVGPAVPLLAVLGALAVSNRVHEACVNRRLFVGAVGAVAVGSAVLVGDPFLAPFEAGFHSVTVDTARTVGAYALLFIGVLFAVHVLRRRAPDRVSVDGRTAATIALIVVVIGTNGATLAIQSSADYSTHYYYGQEGMEETLKVVQEKYKSLPEDARKRAVFPTDIGYYVDGPYHDKDRYTVADFQRDKPPLVVLRNEQYYRIDSPLLSVLQGDENYTGESYGSFTVFVRTPVNESG